MFKINDAVLHVKTGKIYIIRSTPENTIIEKTMQKAYVYSGEDRMNWIRSQEEMEDGRFEIYVESKEKYDSITSITLNIKIIESTDPSIQCIHAIREIMDYFQKEHSNKLSPQGKDIKAVYHWFLERYKIGINL